ncbi:MAG: FAD-dependent monooxygenase [Burkholderiaceae bacterium]|nr:FAD-dependent monooxygenase [Burkholderiaceae bacterium]
MNPDVPHFPIAICGAGPVGSAFALMLIQRGTPAQDIVLFDGKSIQDARQDVRSIALSYGSRQLLQNIGAWPLRCTPIKEIHVSRRGHFGRSLLLAQDYDLPELGYVARYGDIITPLQEQLETRAIKQIRPLEIKSLESDDLGIKLIAANSQNFTASLVVQAEGGHLTVDADTKPASQGRDYQQVALIAHVVTEQGAGMRAFERFTDEGPLALLPQEDGYALVWCAKPDTVTALKNLDERQFLNALQTAFGHRLGRFIKATPRHSYPLGLQVYHAMERGNEHDITKTTPPQEKLIRIGNAAQTLHPVAGQGLNLGLRDAHKLAQVLTEYSHSESIIQFNETRTKDRATTIRLTDNLARLFVREPSSKIDASTQSVLGLGLGLFDTMPVLKRLLAERMMFGTR